MSEEKTIKMFCTILGDFFEDLYKSYPDPSLFILKQTSKAMMTATPRLVVENFMFCVEPYKERILKKDESFFIKGGLANNLKNTDYGFLVDEINKVSEIWNRPETSMKTKESIWKYFGALITLGSKIKNNL